MKKFMLAVLGVIMILTALVGCASSRSNTDSSSVPRTTAVPAPAAPGGQGIYFGNDQKGPSTGVYPAPIPSISVVVPPATAAATVQYGGEAAGSPSSLPSDRMVVRTGNMQIVVNDIASVIDSIGKIAVNYGGYVVSSQQGKQGEKNVGNIAIRVLAEDYDKSLADIRALAKSVTNESTTSQDVTQEYVDLDARVRNLEATEAQLLKIMQSATKTEDILAIQSQLTDVRGQIDQTKARMQYLQRTSATSLIQVQLEEAILAIKFNADKVSAAMDEPFRFTAQITGGFPPYNYQWDFGDGNTSNEASPTHVYKNAGVYNISLKVTDDKGYTNTLARTAYIGVVESWKPGNVAADAWNGFMAFGRGFVNVLIYLAIFSPVWLVIGGIVWLMVYRRKRKKS